MSFEFYSSADMLGKVFWLCAICGTLFFCLRLIMMIVAGDISDTDGDIDDGSHMSDSSDAAFEILSIHTITALIMMFGWGGLTCYLQFGLGHVLSILTAAGVGIFAMAITAFIFKMASSLVSKGGVFRIHDTVGMNASVYQQIPAEGLGKIHISMPNGGTREMNAVSAEKNEIPSFQTVKIVEVVDNHTLSVRKI
jgi:hypothetical protein